MDKPRNDNQGIVLPSAFKYTLRMLEFLHPYLAMRLAAFFFAKPFRHQFLERETPVLSKAQKSSVQIQGLDKSVFCYHWQGMGPKIMLMHGWSGRATNFFKIIERGAISSSVIFILLAMGSVLSFFITIIQVPDILKDFLINIDAGMITFLLVVNIAFFLAGMFIDPNSALLILVPPLFPVAVSLGIDPIHFGLIVTLNIGIGMITPPFGLDIFVASSTLNKPVITIISGIWPFLLVNVIVLIIITYVPEISTFLPNLMRN